MKKGNKRVCKNCVFWEEGISVLGIRFNQRTGRCNNSLIWKWVCASSSFDSDQAIIGVEYPQTASLYSGPNFGCIHFKVRP